MDPRHSRYVTKAVDFRDVEVALPAEPSPTPPPDNLLAAVGPVPLQDGEDDDDRRARGEPLRGGDRPAAADR